MQRLATNDLVFMYVLRLGVTNIGCRRLLKVADLCPKGAQTLIFLRTDQIRLRKLYSYAVNFAIPRHRSFDIVRHQFSKGG